MNRSLRGSICSLVLGSSLTFPAVAMDIAILGASQQAGLDDVRAKVENAGSFSSVSTIRVVDQTPTLAGISDYDAVLVYSNALIPNSGYDDPQALGNVLADYVDLGGGVVVASFSFDSDSGAGLQGRLAGEGYLPFTQAPDTGSEADLTLVPLADGHPLLFGVNSFNGGDGSYHNASIAFRAGADRVAEWSNGQPLIGALSPSGNGAVVGLNFYPPSSDANSSFWDAATDGDLLMANALVYSATLELRAVMASQIVRKAVGAVEQGLTRFCESPNKRANPAFYGQLCEAD